MEKNTQSMPGAERDDESGQYREKYPTDEFLDAIADAGGMAGTQDVADYVGCSYETAYKKLRKLEDDGTVDSQKVANARAWRVSTPRDGQDSAESDPSSEPDRAGVVNESATPRERAREILDDLDRPGEGADYEQRLDAVLQMYDHLRSNPGERLERQDFRELLAGKDVGYGGGFASLWSNWVKAYEDEGRPENALAVLPGVELRGDSYVYTGGGPDA